MSEAGELQRDGYEDDKQLSPSNEAELPSKAGFDEGADADDADKEDLGREVVAVVRIVVSFKKLVG